MKRLILILVLLLSYHNFHPLLAQVGIPRTDLAIGGGGGFVMNKVTFNPSIKQSFKNGLTMGFTARYTCELYFKMICGFQCELNFSQAGWKEKSYTGNGTYQRTLNYLHMPLLSCLGFGRERGGVKGFLLIGPQLGFCVGESEKISGDGSGFVPAHLVGNLTQHELKVQKKFEYGITGGLGMDVSTKNGNHFIIEGRYFYGLSDIFSNTKKDPFGRSANTSILAKVSYLFDIKKTKL